MSRLIERLKAEKNDPRTAEEITYDLGQQLEASGNKDVFAANPDFFNEYLDIKDSLRRPLGNEIWAALTSSVRDTLPEQGFNAAAAAYSAIRGGFGDMVGEDFKGDKVTKFLHGQAEREREEGQLHRGDVSIPDVEQIRDIGDLGRFATVSAAESLPQSIPSLIGGAGAAARGAKMLGTMLAVAAPTMAQQTGEIYGNMPDEVKGTTRAGVAAIAGGIPAGALDATSVIMGPLGKLLNKGGPQKQILESILTKIGAPGVYHAVENVLSRGGLKGALANAAEGAILEGPTEWLQEAISIAAEEYAQGKELDKDAIASRLKNAAAAGSAAGALTGGLFGLKGNRRAQAQVSPEDQAAFDNSVLEPAGPMQFGDLPLTRNEQMAFDGVAVPPPRMDFGPAEAITPEEYQALYGVTPPAGPMQFQTDEEIDFESFADQALNAARGAGKLTAPLEAELNFEADTYVPPKTTRPSASQLPILEGPPAGLPDKYDITKPLLGPGNELYAADAPSPLNFDQGMFEAARSPETIRTPEEVARDIWAYQEAKRKNQDATQKQSPSSVPAAQPPRGISELEAEVRKAKENLAESRKLTETEPLISLAPTVKPEERVQGGPPLVGRLFGPEDGGTDARIAQAAIGSRSNPKEQTAGTHKAVVLLDRASGQVLVKGIKPTKGIIRGERRAGISIDDMQLIRDRKSIIDAVLGNKAAPWEVIKNELHRGLPRFDVMGYYYYDEPRSNVNYAFENLAAFEAHPQMAEALRNFETRGEGAAPEVREKIAKLFPHENEANLKKLSPSQLKKAKEEMTAADYKKLLEQQKTIPKGGRTKQATGGGGRVDVQQGIHETTDSPVISNMADAQAVDPAQAAEQAEIAASTANVPPMLAKLAEMVRANKSEAEIMKEAAKVGLVFMRKDKNFARATPEQKKKMAASLAPTIVKQLKEKTTKFSMRNPSAWLLSPPHASALLGQVIKAVQAQGVDVVGLMADINSNYDALAKQYAFTLQDNPRRRPLIALTANWLISNAPDTRTVLDALHEAAHIFMDKSGMVNPADRAVFQEAVEFAGWDSNKAMVGPMVTDLRILANTPSAFLNEEQLGILSRATEAEMREAMSISPEELLEERAVEHLGLMGVDEVGARSIWKQIVRFIKDLWYQVAIAFQKHFMPEDADLNKDLLKKYVENRWIQFLNRDFAASNAAINLTFREWIGAPTTIGDRIPVYSNLDGDAAINFWNPETGVLETIEPTSDAVDSVQDRIKLALDRYRAETSNYHPVLEFQGQLQQQWNALHDADEKAAAGSQEKVQIRKAMDSLTDVIFGLGFNSTDMEMIRKREIAAGEPIKFSMRKNAGEALGAEGPTIAANTTLASINFENEVFTALHKDPVVAQYLPVGTTYDQFLNNWLQLSPSQNPVQKKQAAVERITEGRDAYGNPFGHDPNVTIASLPASVNGSSAQQAAVRDTLRKLNSVKRSLVRRTETLTERKDELVERKNNLTAAEKRELDKINSQLPMFERLLVNKETGIDDRIKYLEGKMGAAFLWDATPGATFFVPPSTDAGEIAVRGSTQTIPANIVFDTPSRQKFYEAIVKQTQWLANEENKNQGALYGEIAIQNRKLQKLVADASYTAQTLRLRNTYFDSLRNMLRGIGTPLAKNIATSFDKLDAFLLRWGNTAQIGGTKWSRAYEDFKKSVNWNGADEDFRRLWWNRIMDYAESVPDGVTDPYGAVIAAMEGISKLKMSSDAKSKLRVLLRENDANQKWINQAFESEGLKVEESDSKLPKGLQRNLIRQGFQTGRRGISEHLDRIVQEMRVRWNGTDFFEELAERYATDPNAVTVQAGQLFTPTVLNNFVKPFIYNNRQYFKAPAQDGAVARMASLSNVRAAFEASNGNMVDFAKILNELEGGNEATEADTIASTMGVFRGFYRRMQAISNERQGATAAGVEALPRQIMDARQADDFPPEFVNYATYDASANRTLLFQLGLNSSFGRNGLTTGEFRKNLSALEEELKALKLELANLVQIEGKSKDGAKKIMGDDRYTIALQASDHLSLLGRMTDKIGMVTKSSGSLMADVRLLDELVAFNANMVLQQPTAALTNTLDVLSPFYRLKLSTQAFAAFKNDVKTLVNDVFGSLMEAFGIHITTQTETNARMSKLGLGDPENYLTWKDKLADYGPGNFLDEPSGVESLGHQVKRKALRGVRLARQITNVGVSDVKDLSTLRSLGFDAKAIAPGDKNIAPKFRLLGIFNMVGQSLANGAIDGQYQNFKDMISRGVELVKDSNNPDEMVTRLLDGRLKLSAQDMGYTRKWMLFNDEAAFDYMKNAISEKMAEGSLERMVADAYTRQQNGDVHLITDRQFVSIANLALTEFQLNSNFSNAPIDLKAGGGLWRMLSPFLSWPYYAMLRVPAIFKDANNQWKMKAAMDGVAATLMAIVPLTMAASMMFDWFDENIVGKRRNLRATSPEEAIPGYGPVVAPMATLERLGRYGAGGLLTEALNSAVNVDDARGGMTADNRILLFSQLKNFKDIVGNLWQEGPSNANYTSVFRPFAQFLGLGGVLQYQQIVNKQLGLTNEEAAVNNRINIANYLRAAGRDINLDVRISRGPSSVPNQVTPYLQNMELAAYMDDINMFRDAYNKAVRSYHEIHPDDPDAARQVIRSFQTRHPLKRVFVSLPSEKNYRDLLDDLNPTGREAVTSGVRQFNRYLMILGARPVDPRDNPVSVVQQMSRQIMSNEAIRQAQAMAAQSAYYGSF